MHRMFVVWTNTHKHYEECTNTGTRMEEKETDKNEMDSWFEEKCQLKIDKVTSEKNGLGNKLAEYK